MATKNSSSALVSGLGMAMAFIQSLVNEVVALGGFEEMLHPLTREHGQPIIRKLAEVIVKSEWKIPRSLVERLAVAESLKQWGTDYQEFDQCFFWDIIGLTDRFGVPVISFSNDEGSDMPIPSELIEQLVGRNVTYPMILTWNGELYVVASICNDSHWEIGKIYNGTLSWLKLPPAKYFDLER